MHTLKTQLAINLKNMQIVDLAFSNGKKHDFKLFKESCFHVKPNSTIIADSAYQGLHKIHSNSLLPKKRSFCSSSDSDLKIKLNNQLISKKRIFVEHAIRFVKRFRILSHTYRNRRHRFFLRFSLISGICNFDSLLA